MKILASQLNTPINSVKSDFVKQNLQSGEHTNAPSFGFKPFNDKHWIAQSLSWTGDHFSSTMQRGITGVTAFFLQPWFDYNNKHVDEDTRKVSTARTMAKIIVGTGTGVFIREACIQGCKYFAQNNNIRESENKNPLETFTKWQQILLPEGKEFRANLTPRQIKTYRGAVGTVAALFIMLGTNFLVDAPLTTYLTNKITPMFMKKKNSQNVAEGGE